MSVFSDDSSESNGKRSTRWEGYSNYQAVSQQIAQKVGKAIQAYAILQSAAKENADLDPREYMEARARILDAAMSLKYEVEREASNADKESESGENSIYVDIAHRWNEGDDDIDSGYVSAFHNLSFRKDGIKGWVFTFVEDIRRAAWELGYLQAGRSVRTYDDTDPNEEEAREMFD